MAAVLSDFDMWLMGEKGWRMGERMGLRALPISRSAMKTEHFADYYWEKRILLQCTCKIARFV
jgi:hypothetical protein